MKPILTSAPSRDSGSGRFCVLDLLRGINLISMIAYHGAYDLVYLYGVDLPGYRGTPGYLWQQSICWLFIFLSGFCFCLGRFDGGRRIRRGLLLSSCGILITAVTMIVMPSSLIILGVLSFFGLAVLLSVLLYPLLRRIPAPLGLICCLLLFFLTRDVSSGWLGFEGLRLFPLPGFLYRGAFMMILGFPWPGFFSTDYFPLLPWIFLFWSGFYTFRLLSGQAVLRFLKPHLCAPLEFIGRHTLPIYMIHQPALMAVFFLAEKAGLL
ncbi:MAG TPA: DUF1624 domain-containing protein [Candidatus Eisenbergiella merdipullorum]|uniref:DUF1624 domain-containing protein n=1 Tax=Candidatus Eisenbergiella merdipullorum TaxID=2838553 RepID=A0A9D2L016_9FIRM|nr:DUF1624 domain-containing protein [Candidatus Eisenbergiella merdipullorum]